jgi:hypothetical protein
MWKRAIKNLVIIKIMIKLDEQVGKDEVDG